jgi:hypothetical protein
VSAPSTFAMALLSRLSIYAVAKTASPEGTNGHSKASNGVPNNEQLPQKLKKVKKNRHAKMRRRGGESSEESDESQGKR